MILNIFTIILVSSLSYTVISYYNSAKEIKNQIYFDIWYNKILTKNELRELLYFKDLEYGYKIGDSPKYFTNEKTYITLRDFEPRFKYISENKKLDIYLNIYDSGANKQIKYKNVSEETSKQICRDMLRLLSQNNLIINGSNDIDVTLNHIDFITCYFTFNIDEMASGEPVGGIIYKRNKKSTNNFDFDFFKSFDNADFS